MTAGSETRAEQCATHRLRAEPALGKKSGKRPLIPLGIDALGTKKADGRESTDTSKVGPGWVRILLVSNDPSEGGGPPQS